VLRARAPGHHRSISCSLAAGHRGVVRGHLTRRQRRVDAVGDQRSCKESDMARQRPSTRPTWSSLDGPHHRDDGRCSIARQGRSGCQRPGNWSPDGRSALPALPRAGRSLGAWPAKSTESPYGYPYRWESALPRRRLVENVPIYRLHAMANAEDLFSAQPDNGLCAVRGDRVR
jgi:hypothetical protein